MKIKDLCHYLDDRMGSIDIRDFNDDEDKSLLWTEDIKKLCKISDIGDLEIYSLTIEDGTPVIYVSL